MDDRRNCQSFYLPDGDSLTLDMENSPGPVATRFEPARIEQLVRWAQANGPDYSYKAFSEQAKAAGCAGYRVSFLGRRVVYFVARLKLTSNFFQADAVGGQNALDAVS